MMCIMKRLSSFIILTIIIMLNLGCKEHIVSPSNSAVDISWAFLGLKNESISSIVVDPTNANIIYAGSSYDFSSGTPGRLFKSTNRGKTWDTLTTNYGAQFLGLVIDPRNHEIIHAAWWGLIKSYDGGTTWQDEGNGIIVTPGETHVCALIMDPNNSNVLYAGTAGPMAGYLYKSTDAGANWKALGNDSLGDGIQSIAFDPLNSNTVYIGTEFNGMLRKSIDAGGHWQWPGFAEKGLLKTIAIDPGNSQRIIAGTSVGGFSSTPVVWISENGGNSFQPFNQGILDNTESCYGLQFNSESQFDLYEGGYGVYHKTDINSEWISFNQGLPENSRVQVLVLGQDNNLYAGMMVFDDSLRKGGIYHRTIVH
jgi:hypothetical protein